MTRTVAQKLTIKDGDVVFVAGGGEPGPGALVNLPEGATTTDEAANATVALLGVRDRAELSALLDGELAELADKRAIWILYPKGNRADVNRDIIWADVKERGWRLVSNIAIDDTWSAVRAKPDGDGR